MKKHHLMFAACFMFLSGKPAFSAYFEIDVGIVYSHEEARDINFDDNTTYTHEGMMRQEGWREGDTIQLGISYMPNCEFSSPCAHIGVGATGGDYSIDGEMAIMDQESLNNSVGQHSLSGTAYSLYEEFTFYLYDETIDFLDDSGNLNMLDDAELSSDAYAYISYRRDRASYASSYYSEADIRASSDAIANNLQPVPLPPAFWLFGSGLLSMLLGKRKSFSRGSYLHG
jgi:hypothetical protein